ncbi:MAG TPA: endopeptidase La [Ktedonobacterales bacterium]|nr:endopeptidase La [Ktedonobacterales bacterium]
MFDRSSDESADQRPAASNAPAAADQPAEPAQTTISADSRLASDEPAIVPVTTDESNESEAEAASEEEGEAPGESRSEIEPEVEIPDELAVLPLKDTVVYPFSVVPLGIGKERSIRLIDDVMRGSRLVALVAQKDSDVEEAGPEDCYRIGVVARIARMLRMPDGTMNIIVQGLDRIAITDYTATEPFLKARVKRLPETTEDGVEIEARTRTAIDLFQRLVNLVQYLPDQLAMAVMNLDDPRQVVYLIASNAQMDLDVRQALLEMDSVRDKLDRVTAFLTHELEVLELGKKIQSEAQEEMGKVQREYILREQLKAIQKELGEESEEAATINELREKIEQANMNDEARKEASRELSRLEKIPSASPEYSVIRTYLELLISLPWNKSTGKPIDVAHARQVLDEDHYDLEKIKDRILEYLSVRRLKEDRQREAAARAEAEKAEQAEQPAASAATSATPADERAAEEAPAPPPANTAAERAINREPILCFVGPPGVGKTSLGQSIARALGREFVRLSLGGVHDEAEIRGHRRTYIGAMPGRILQSLRRAGTNDPVFMLDEVDKLAADWRGDPSSAMLEVLDPEQNFSFRDNYLDLPFDLSKVMFIATANALDPIPAALRDRMEVLELAGYTEEEKLHIARRYLLPKQIRANGLTADEIALPDETVVAVIRNYTREAGVRGLEREIGSICRKVARQIAEGVSADGAEPRTVTPDMLRDFLGRQRYFAEAAERIDRPGIVTGMAWTSVGGDIMFIEAAMMPSRDNQLLLTGQLGDVMKESAQAALTYVRSNAQALGIDPRVFDGKAFHIHVPEGAIPKDGPSAGITMTTAIASLVTGRKARSDVAMTGEISLRGKVLPIGGLKEKVLAANRAGITTIILPKRNEYDLEELPKELRAQMTFVPVDDAREALMVALEGGLPAHIALPGAPSLPDQGASGLVASPS